MNIDKDCIEYWEKKARELDSWIIEFHDTNFTLENYYYNLAMKLWDIYLGGFDDCVKLKQINILPPKHF